jgi:hypothetical protein
MGKGALQHAHESMKMWSACHGWHGPSFTHLKHGTETSLKQGGLPKPCFGFLAP